jgi:hypothetical protein
MMSVQTTQYGMITMLTLLVVTKYEIKLLVDAPVTTFGLITVNSITLKNFFNGFK